MDVAGERWEFMILASLRFRVQPHKRAEAVSAAEALMQRILSLADCGSARLLTDAEDANAFTLLSEWTNVEAAEQFFESRDFEFFKTIRIVLRDEPVILLDDVKSRVMRLVRD
jgi:quinol monooxygenase YgiN